MSVPFKNLDDILCETVEEFITKGRTDKTAIAKIGSYIQESIIAHPEVYTRKYNLAAQEAGDPFILTRDELKEHAQSAERAAQSAISRIGLFNKGYGAWNLEKQRRPKPPKAIRHPERVSPKFAQIIAMEWDKYSEKLEDYNRVSTTEKRQKIREELLQILREAFKQWL